MPRAFRPVPGGRTRRLGLTVLCAARLFPATLHESPLRAGEPSPVHPAHAAGEAPSQPDPPAPTTPERLKIATIGLDARIESLGLTPEGNIDVPRDAGDAGWYELGPRPGSPGDAVIVGHLDSQAGPAVFWRLARVCPGDRVVVVYGDGVQVDFRVQRLASYDVGRPPPDLSSPHGPARLTLITCSGSWNGSTYRNRLLVEATR